MQKLDRLALTGIRQMIREIFRNHPTNEDIVELMDMGDHLKVSVQVKLWKQQKQARNKSKNRIQTERI